MQRPVGQELFRGTNTEKCLHTSGPRAPSEFTQCSRAPPAPPPSAHMKDAYQKEIDNEQQVAQIEKAKVLLEIEKSRINQLLGILADSSTQAALLAGSAVGAVSGESIDSFDDENGKSMYALGHRPFFTAVYVVAGAASLSSSLWVIFTASHLIARARDSIFQPKIRGAREILERGVHEVAVVKDIAIVTLLITITSSAWLNMRLSQSFLFTLIVGLISWQAALNRDDLDDEFDTLYEGSANAWREQRMHLSMLKVLTRSFRQTYLARKLLGYQRLRDARESDDPQSRREIVQRSRSERSVGSATGSAVLSSMPPGFLSWGSSAADSSRVVGPSGSSGSSGPSGPSGSSAADPSRVAALLAQPASRAMDGSSGSSGSSAFGSAGAGAITYSGAQYGAGAQKSQYGAQYGALYSGAITDGPPHDTRDLATLRTTLVPSAAVGPQTLPPPGKGAMPGLGNSGNLRYGEN